MTELKVVAAASADAGRVLALMARYRSEAGEDVGDEQADVVATLLRTPSMGRAYLGLAGGRDVGFALAFYSQSVQAGGRVASIDDFYIVPEQRRQGMGRDILVAVIGDCRDRGIKRCVVHTNLGNLAAVKLCASLGFRRRSESTLALEIADLPE